MVFLSNERRTIIHQFSDAQGQITLESVVVSGRNLNSSKLSCMYSLPARIKMIKSKMKELEWSQHFPHYKSIEMFPDAQGQLIPQSLVHFDQNLNSTRLYGCPWYLQKMKKIQSKMNALECSQQYASNFQTRKEDNSRVGGGIWPKFELIQAFMHVLVT